MTAETLKKAKADYLGSTAVEAREWQLRGVKIDVMVGVRDLVLSAKSFPGKNSSDAAIQSCFASNL